MNTSKTENARLTKAFRDYARRMKIGRVEAAKILASRMGYTNYRTVYLVLRGERIPSGHRGAAMARELGASYEYLYGE
jgi:hypothetical protein